MSIAIKRNFTIPSTSSIGASEISLSSSTASTSVTTGAIISLGGAGISGAISLGGPLKLYNGSYYTGFDSAATANTTYIWPATSPATGTSVLSSDAAGNLSWVLMSASGSGLTLNGLTATTQYFSTSISGSGFTIGSIGSTHTFYISLAGSASTGLISSAAQTIFGTKTFASGVAITSGTASTSTTTGDLIITGGVGIGGSLNTQTLTVGSGVTGLIIQKMVGGNYVAMYSTGVTPSGTNYTFITDGQSPNFNGTNGIYFNISNSNKVQITNTNINVTPTTGSTSTSTGSLTVAGGLGIGGSLWTATTNFSSISGVGHSNSVITSGVWSGTAISAVNGGTGLTSYTTGDILYASSSSSLGKITAGSASSILTSAGAGTTPYWAAPAATGVTSLAASTGISVNASTGAVTVTNTGVIALTGTANQILVNGGSGSATSGNITLTTPQSIGTASSPSFADVALTTGSNSTLASVGSAPTSIVNKQYVDNLASGLDIHGSVRVIQISSIGASYVQTQSAGSASTGSYLISTTQVALPSIDGITVSATGTTQRVLINGGFTGTATIGGTTPFTPGNSNIANGIYYVSALGGAGTSNWILVRATDTDENTELTGGTFTFVEEGTTYSDSGWVCSNDTTNLGPIQFGNTAITFTQFTGGGALSVGQGLNKVSNTIAAKINISPIGTPSGTGYTQFNLGGTSGGGTADTGYYPTFGVRTSGTIAGSAILTLNSDGFSLIGSTNLNRTITVTGSDITLTGGGNTLTLTGSISLPSPTANGIAYGSSSSAISFLTASGSGASVLTQTSGSAPTYLSQSQLNVGNASIASSASLVNIDASTGTRYLLGTALNTASGSTQVSVGSGITIGNNLLTSGGIAVTNSTASTSTSTGALIVTGGVGIGASVNIGGKVGVGTNVYTGALSVISPTTSTIGLVVRKIASQSASTFEIQDDYGNQLISISYNGGSGGTVGSGVLNIHANRDIGDASSETVFAVKNSSTEVFRIGRNGTLGFNGILTAHNGSGSYETIFQNIYGSRVNWEKLVWFNGSGFNFITAGVNFNNSSSQLTMSHSGTSVKTGIMVLANGWGSGGGSRAFGIGTPGAGERTYFTGYGNLVINPNNPNGLHSEWNTMNLLYLDISGTASTFSGNIIQGKVEGSDRFVVGPYGNTTVSLGGTTVSNALILKGATSQTGNLMEFQSSTGTTLLYINSSGQFGPVSIASTTGSGSTTTGALIVSGGVGIGGSLNIYQTTTHSDNILINSAKEVRFYNSSNTFYSGIKAGVTTSSTTFTLPIADGSANQVLLTNGSAALGFTTTLLGLNGLNTATQTFATSISGSGFTIGSSTSTHTFYIALAGNGTTGLISATSQSIYGAKTFINDLAISSSTASTSTSTGALTISGGVGIGGSLWTATTNFSSISGVGHSNSTITSGTWAGNAISAIYGGTGNTSYSVGDILYANSTTTLGKITAGSAGSVLTSAGAGTTPYWAAIGTSAVTIATTTDTSSTLYLIGTRSNGGFAGTALYVDTGISALGNTITATTFSGTATTSSNTAAINVVLDTTSTIYLSGSRSNTSIGSTALYILSGVSALGNTITATTFSGTATTATNTANTNVVLDTTSTIYLTGSRSNASIGSTPVYVLSGVSALGNTITATTFSGTASSAALVNVASSTTTKYLAGFVLNTATGSTQLYTGSGITIGDNRLTTGGLAVTSGTASTNTTTGALTVAGGVGITGQLSVNAIALGTTGVSVTPTMTYVGTAGTVISMSVLSDTTLAWEGSSGQLFSIDNNLSSGEIFSVSDISGLPVITASAGQTVTLNEFGGYTQVGNGLASTNTTTGALRVIGGVGVTGAVNIAGNTSVSSSTASTNTTTGALVVTGGIGVGASVNIAGNTSVSSSTASTSTSSGALVVTGGVGIGASVNIAGNTNITSSTASTSTTTGALIITGGAGIGGTLNIGGNIRAGSNTFSKAGIAAGDVLLDNGTTDTPGLLFYWGNNKNIGIDTYYPGTGSTRFRIVKELNESGGSELWSIDRNGIIIRSAWDVGEVIASRMYNYSDLNMSATTTVGVNTYVRIANLTYTPKSSSSYIWIEFSCVYEIAGAAADDFYSNITVNGTEVVYNRQICINGAGCGTRSGALFPISARYTNSSTSGIAITVQAARGSSDDNGTFVGNSVSGYMRIMEIGR